MGRVGDEGKLMVVLITATRDLPCEEEWVKEMTEALPFVVSIYHNVHGPERKCDSRETHTEALWKRYAESIHRSAPV